MSGLTGVVLVINAGSSSLKYDLIDGKVLDERIEAGVLGDDVEEGVGVLDG